MHRTRRLLSPLLLFPLLFLAFAFVVFLAGPAFAGSENGKKVGHDKDDAEVVTQAATTEKLEEASATDESGATRSGTEESSGETEASSKKSPAVTTQDATDDTKTTTTSETTTSKTTTAATSNQGGNPTHGCAQATENDGDPYDSTCDGSPALNGGKVHKNHCAGCVGAADNMNPSGQMPDGSDHNNGYECDGNNGVGKTNPAHSGCLLPPPPPPCVDNPNTPMDECNPVPPPPRVPPEVEGVIIPNFERETTVRGNRPGQPPLPFTGAPTTPFLMMGLLMVAAGGSLLRFSGRRRRHA